MNQEQEYEEAERMLATLLWSRIGGDPLKSLGIIAALLQTTWPSGQRVLAVLASNQAVPETAYTAALEPDTWERIQSDLRTEGFRRVVHPELKQEAKK